MTHYVVYSERYGGFGISKAALDWLEENARQEVKDKIKECRRDVNDEYKKRPNLHTTAKDLEEYTAMRLMYWMHRHDNDLVRCVKTLGRKANGEFAELKVRKLKGNKYRIEEYDGYEEVFEPGDEKYITIE